MLRTRWMIWRRHVYLSCSGMQGDSEAVQGPSDSSIEEDSPKAVKKAKKQRLFDFSQYNKRHIALKLAYLGKDYSGLAIQGPAEKTVEGVLFDGLLKTKLIEDPQTCQYSRCGRTDKGVSAFCQVVSLYVRTNLLEGDGVIVPKGSKAHERPGDKTTEACYVKMLNSVLPEDIRVLAWAPVSHDFSARFSCLQRTYKYFFPRGTLDIEAMKEGSQKFVGEHDFRNFCRMDVKGGMTNFRRRVLSVAINRVDGPEDSDSSSPYQVYELIVVGLAFLWHQIRCMVAILFLVGSGLEKAEIIDHMLNIAECPKKPQYGMALALPLVLYDCVFEDVDWQVDEKTSIALAKHFQHLWTKHMIEASMMRRMVDGLTLPLMLSGKVGHVPCSQVTPLICSDHRLGGAYKPLMDRPTGSSFEERHEFHHAKKRMPSPQDSACKEPKLDGDSI